jgi:hypothetical protein
MPFKLCSRAPRTTIFGPLGGESMESLCFFKADPVTGHNMIEAAANCEARIDSGRLRQKPFGRLTFEA